MTRDRFPADWAAAEMLKQYIKNHRKHAIKAGRMESRADKKRREKGKSRLLDVDVETEVEDSDGEDEDEE